MDKYISYYTGEQIDALLSQIQSNVSQADLDALKAELVLRLQGTSTNQDGYKDPIFYKEFVGSATLDDMNTWLDNQFFAIKDGVYYRNGQSGSYAISKDVPQCLINLSYQGVKIYVYNAPRSFATGTFEQFAIGAAVGAYGITWGSHIMRRESTYDFTTKKATWTAWEKINSDVDKSYVDTQLATKVDKVAGKGLSTNDYTTAEKTKLAGVETGANKTIVDTQLSTSSTNPVQNKAVAASLNAKVNIILGKGLSTNDYTTEEKNLVATIPSKASEEYVDENILQLAKQRTSFVTPCFSDCDSTHEAKCNRITLSGGELGFGFKSIFSVTIKIAESLSLLNQTSTYLHIKDLFGNSIGVSMNGVKQMLNLGKYATWFFDSVINTSGGPIVLSLHTTNVASSASDSNLVKIIAHVNQNEGMKACGVTDENGTYHTNWTPALGINVVNLAAIYPQIKELQKYRMAYATSELPDISTTGHKANVKEIRINQNVMGISLVNSVSIMVASDSAYSGALELRVYDINDNLIATSNNTVNLSQNLGKYVTWYFTPFQLNTDAIYKFSVWYSGTSQVMRIHVASGKSEGVTCFDQNNSPHTDYCPAFGINISAIFADDLNKNIKEVNLALGKEILTNSSSINSLVEAMEGVLYDIGQIKDNIEIAGSTVIALEASALGITSDTALTEGAVIDVYSGESGGGMLSTEITLNTGQTIISSANNIRALTVFAGNVMGRIKHRVLQVGEINYTANEPMSVYVCYRPQGAISTEVKVRDRTQLEEQITQKADTGYVNAQVKILTTALETKANKTYVDTQLASRSGLLHIGEVSSEDDFFSRIATHAVVTNPTAQIVTATYTSGSGTGTLVALQQVRANISGDGGGTTMQYIYCNKRRYTRYIDFSATAIISVQSLQTEGVRNLQYDNGVLSLKDIWGDTIGSTVNLTSVDKTAIREGTSTASQVQLTITKPFGNTASAYISAATSAKAGIMTSAMYNRLNYLLEQIGYAVTSNETATQGEIYISTHGLAPGGMVDITTIDSDHANLSTRITLKDGQTIEVSIYSAILVEQTPTQAQCVAYGSNISYTATGTEKVYIYNEAFPVNYVLRDPSRLDRLEARIAALEAK